MELATHQSPPRRCLSRPPLTKSLPYCIAARVAAPKLSDRSSPSAYLIEDYIAEALGVLQIDNTEEDAFNMLGNAIVDAVADDEARTASLFEVWTELEEQRKLS